MIRKNSKIICGFFDNTALINDIYTKTGLITFSGSQFFSFGMKYGLEYTVDYFKKIFMKKTEIKIKSSEQWSNDKWMKNQEEREFINNNGMEVIQYGEAEGKIIGGNVHIMANDKKISISIKK